MWLQLGFYDFHLAFRIRGITSEELLLKGGVVQSGVVYEAGKRRHTSRIASSEVGNPSLFGLLPSDTCNV